MPLDSGYAMPSGESCALKFSSNVTKVASNNSTQSATILGQPSGGAATLGFRGQTTAPIATIPSPPYRYFQWNATLPSPGTRDLAVNLAQYGSSAANQVYEVLDNGAVIGTVTLNNSGDGGANGGAVNPAYFTDAGVQRSDNTGLVRWYPLGRFTFASTSVAVRASSAAVGPPGHEDLVMVSCGDLRIATTDGATVSYLSAAIPPAAVAYPGTSLGGGPSGYRISTDAAPVVEFLGAGAGQRYLWDAATVQSAFQSLPAVGAGNVTCSGDGSPQDPLLFHLAGTLAGQAQPAIVSGDAQVTIDPAVEVGGVLPALAKNGGTPVPVPASWIRADPVGGCVPTVTIAPPVCSPTPVYEVFGQYDDGTRGTQKDNGTDGNWQLGPGGYYNQTWSTAGSTPTFSHYLGPWKGATHRVSWSWTPAAGQSASVTLTIKDWSGNTLGTHTVNQTVAPSGDTDQGVAWEVAGTFTQSGDATGYQLTVSNGTANTMVAGAIRLERTSADDTFRIAEGDTVAMTWGPGAFTTVDDGPVPAQTTPVTLTNLVGGKLVGDPPASHSCEIGMNTQRAAANMGSAIYADLVAMTGDVTAWPTVLNGPSQQMGVNTPPLSSDADGKNWPSIPPGDYVLRWKGAGNCEVTSAGTAVTETGTPTYPGTAGAQNQRQYTLGGSPDHYGPELFIKVHGTTIIGSGPTYNTDVTDVHLYPLGTDLSSPPKFRPDWLARGAAIQCRRFLDPLETIDGNPTTYEDYQPPQSRVSKNIPARTIGPVAVASVAPYAGSKWTLPGQPMTCTTTSAHGFSDYQFFHFTDDCDFTMPLSDGTNRSLGGSTAIVFTLDATSFVFLPYTGSATVTGPIAGTTGGVFVKAGVGMSLQDQVELFNASPASRTFYFNSAIPATQDAVAKCLDYLARNLKPGTRVRHECSNECWNIGGTTWATCCQAGYARGSGDPNNFVSFQAWLSNQHWSWGRAAWVAAGRDPADHVRVMGSQHSNPGVTAALVAECASKGLDLGDEVATAPYLYCAPSYTRNPASEPSHAAIDDRMTVGQTIDQHELYLAFGGYDRDVRPHLDQITPHFPSTRVIYYEGGPEIASLGTRNRNRNSHAVVRHWRWKPIMESWMGSQAAAGCGAIHIFIDSLTDGYIWPVYNCTGQVAYTQSPAQDAIQAGTPDRMDLIQSVMGAAINAMAARYVAPGTTPPPPPPRPGGPRPRGWLLGRRR